VEEKIIGEYIQALNKELDTAETVEAGLIKLIEIKNGYLMLILFNSLRLRWENTGCSSVGMV